MANFPYPYRIHLQQFTQEAIHNQQWGLNISNAPVVGSTFVDALVARRDSSEDSLYAYLLEIEDVVEAFLKPGVTLGNFELWKYPPESYDGQFISATTFVFEHGDSGFNEPCTYRMYTFRTAGNGIMKLTFYDFDNWGNERLGYSDLDVYEKAFVDMVIAPNTAFVGLDNQYAVAFLHASSGQNEALWRRRYRRS